MGGAEDVGRSVGRTARTLKEAADQGQWMDKAGHAAQGAGKTYERTTGRDAESDGKVAGIVAVAGGTMLAAGTAIGAVTAVASTGLVLGVAGVGTAAYCKANGHDRELEQIKGTALKAGSAFIDNAQGFVKGVQKGFDEHNKR